MSLSSRSIRSRSSALLNSNSSSNNHNSNNVGQASHSSTNLNNLLNHTNSTQSVSNSNSSTYARSVYEDDSMIWNEPPLISSSNTLNAQVTPSTTNTTSNNSTNTNTNATTTNTTTTTTTTTNTVESLLTLANKRITTLVYLKKVHEGKVHWFNTILLSRSELEKWFDHTRMINRTTRFAILGMSLSSLLDITNLQDFLKAMVHLLHELETLPSDNNYKPKISNLSRGIFKQSKSARKSAGGSDYSITLQDSGDPSFLYTPNIPFDLDYFEVWITLSDILVEVYQKMINFISVSTNGQGSGSVGVGGVSSSNSNHNMHTSNNNNNNTNGTNSNPTSVSNTPLLSSTTSNTSNISVPLHTHTHMNHTNTSSTSRSSSTYSLLAAIQPSVNLHHLESISRIDSKLKKLIVILTKEIDGMARTAIREELAQLDPMLNSSTTNSTSTSNSNSNFNDNNLHQDDFNNDQSVEWD